MYDWAHADPGVEPWHNHEIMKLSGDDAQRYQKQLKKVLNHGRLGYPKGGVTAVENDKQAFGTRGAQFSRAQMKKFEEESKPSKP